MTLAWALLALVVGSGVVSAMRYKDTLRKMAKDLAIAFGGFALAQCHRPFNWLFLRWGRVERVLGPPDGNSSR